jgi:hypothetical protein
VCGGVRQESDSGQAVRVTKNTQIPSVRQRKSLQKSKCVVLLELAEETTRERPFGRVSF